MKELITKKTQHKSEIFITDKGIQLLESAKVKTGFVENRLLKGFSKEEIEALSNYLDRIYFNIINS